MNASPSTRTPPVATLRRRESATAAMLRQIDDKIARLGDARRDRLAALNHIRCELVRAQEAGQAAPDHHASR